jgi:hypothetical protein
MNKIKDCLSKAIIFYPNFVTKNEKFHPHFVKLSTTDNSIASGAYISLPHWKCLLTDVSTLGIKGGRQIGYHTLRSRYIGTKTFVELVNIGMIGTQGIASDRIALFIKEAIANGREVIYAVDERRNPVGSSTRY